MTGESKRSRNSSSDNGRYTSASPRRSASDTVSRTDASCAGFVETPRSPDGSYQAPTPAPPPTPPRAPPPPPPPPPSAGPPEQRAGFVVQPVDDPAVAAARPTATDVAL